MNDFSYVSKKDRVSYLDSAENKFSEFVCDKNIISKLKNLNQLNRDNIRFIKKINTTLEKGWKYLSKNIEDFKPYPDPTLVHKINVELAFFSGKVSVGEKVFSFYFDKLPKKTTKKGMKEMLPGMTVLWRIVSEGFENPENSYKNYYLNSFNFLIEFSKRCQKEDVFFNI